MAPPLPSTKLDQTTPIKHTSTIAYDHDTITTKKNQRFVQWPLPSLIEIAHLKPPCKVILAFFLNKSFEICGILSWWPVDSLGTETTSSQYGEGYQMVDFSSDVSFQTTPGTVTSCSSKIYHESLRQDATSFMNRSNSAPQSVLCSGISMCSMDLKLHRGSATSMATSS